ncbi:MAG: TRAP transporter large permease subunit [Deltaproteobacteria bacterium]|nr:TRAP transporter large permease subunit [Deltaproteobacteria bacterium]
METKKTGLSAGHIIDGISWTSNFIASLLILMVALAVCYEIVARYFFDAPTEWVMPLSMLAFSWFPFLSAAYGIKTDKHIACDVFVSRAAPYTRELLGVATDLTTLLYIISLGFFGYKEFVDAYGIGSMSSDTIRYPLWIVRIVFPLGMLMCTMQMLRKAGLRVMALRSGQLEKSDKGSYSAKLALALYIVNLGFAIGVFKVNMALGIMVLTLTVMLWGVPIAFGLGTVGFFGLLFFHGSISGLYTIPIVAEKTISHFVLLAIPLFSLGGVILGKSGLGEKIYDLSSKWLAWLPGGLGVATCITGGILAAMIGSSTAVTAIVTLVAMKPLLDRGYSKNLVIGTVTGTSLGLIIPPSIGLIVYGFLTDTSVGALFMAGFVPGSMLVVMFSVYVIIACKITGKYEKMRFSWSERLQSLKSSFVILLGPIFVLGSIYSGLATPTEAGAILVIYSLFCTVLYKRMTLKSFMSCLVESSSISTMILMIMIGALTMTNIVTLLQVPSKLTEMIVNTQMPNVVLISILIVFYLILGMFLDGNSITVLTVPVLAPMLPSLGIDTLAFGVVLMMLVETALLTPPVGLNLFTVKGIVDEPMSVIIKSTFPFVIIIFSATILCLIYPKIALWLPTILMDY